MALVWSQLVRAVAGPCAGGAVYSPAITDFTVMIDQTSHMFITGPDVIKTVTGEDVSFEDLGGARTHNSTSGVAHYMASDESDGLDYVRSLLSYLPSNNLSDPPVFPTPAHMEFTDADHALWWQECNVIGPMPSASPPATRLGATSVSFPGAEV